MANRNAPANLASVESRIRYLSALEHAAAADGRKEIAERRALIDARAKCATEISKAATAFLKANGFDGGGKKKYSRKIPGLNC